MKTMVRKRTGPAKARARRLAFFFATILGMVSPKMMTLTVTMTVAIQVSSSPKAVMAMTEPKEEMDRFIEALVQIKRECEAAAGEADNVVVNAPHTARELAGEWSHPYTREQAAFPLRWIGESKFFPYVSKIDNGYEIQVPLFINQGDIVKIDTRTGEYAERVSKA